MLYVSALYIPQFSYGRLQHLVAEIQDHRTKIWKIDQQLEDTPTWFKTLPEKREKILKELYKAQVDLAEVQEIFWDLNVPGDPVQQAQERLAEANCWRNFRIKRDRAQQQALYSKEDKLNLELLRKKIGLAVSVRDAKVELTTRTVSSRLWPVNQTDSQPGSARDSARASAGTPPPLTLAVKKPNKIGAQERKRVRSHRAKRAPIGIPGVHTAEECPEFKAWADVRKEEHAEEKAKTEWLASRTGTPDNWEWHDIVTEDGLEEQ
eukprot:1718128-Rhodomonas_salina.1